jgi:hypothetical protein
MLMATRARRLMAATALLATGALMVLSSATTASADLGPAKQSHADSTAAGQVITVSVWGDGYRGGSSGSGCGGRVSVSVPAPCWMSGWSTGKEYYEYVATGLMARDNHHFGENMTPLPGYEKYQDDDKGQWYGAECTSANWPGPDDLPGFFTFADTFFAAHPSVYVPADQTPPTPPVPPALLREIAIQNLTLPDPELDWNPKRSGTRALW